MKFLIPLTAHLLMTVSCSFKLQHSDGSVTYLGSVNIREGSAGDLPFMHSRRLGLLLDTGTTNNSISIGYDDRLIVKPPNDTVTEIDYSPGSDPVVSIQKRQSSLDHPKAF